MRTTQTFVALLALGLQISKAQDVWPTEILDLTKSADTSSVPGTGGHGWIGHSPGGTVEGHVPLPLPLQVRIVQREPAGNQLSLGDTVGCEVELTNTGGKPFTIPWSRGQVTRPETAEEAASTGYQDANVAVVVVDKTGRDHVIGAFMIDSSPLQSSTSRTILPGETVAIRVSFRPSLQEEGYQTIFGGLAKGTAVDVRLAASFSFSPYSYSSGFSLNTIPISLVEQR